MMNVAIVVPLLSVVLLQSSASQPPLQVQVVVTAVSQNVQEYKNQVPESNSS